MTIRSSLRLPFLAAYSWAGPPAALIARINSMADSIGLEPEPGSLEKTVRETETPETEIHAFQ